MATEQAGRGLLHPKNVPTRRAYPSCTSHRPVRARQRAKSISEERTYGEDLTVIASEIGETYNCFEDVIPVTGAATLTSPDIDASVASIGLYGSLAPLYEGTITGSTSETAFTLYAVGCGVDASVVAGALSVDLLVTPTTAGTITAASASSAHWMCLKALSRRPSNI